jgi:hypothetical protein
LYRDLCFDDSPELRSALFTVRDTSLPIELSNKKEEDVKKALIENSLDWL